MITTSNYNLNMPDQNDFYNIDDINENMETIDSVMYDMEQNTLNMSEKIGNTTDTGATETTGTVMGKLNSIIKNSGSEKIYRSSDTENITRIQTLSTVSGSGNNDIYSSEAILASDIFTAKYDGIITLKVTATNNKTETASIVVLGDSFVNQHSKDPLGEYYVKGQGTKNVLPLIGKPKGTKFNLSFSDSALVGATRDMGSLKSSEKSTVIANASVKKGDRIQLAFFLNKNSTSLSDITFDVSYSVEEV